MMDRDKSRMETLFSLAQELPGACRRSNGWQARIAAQLFVKNEAVSIGWNQNRSSPFQAKWGKNEEAIFLHAEIHTIKQAIKRMGYDNLRRAKTTLYICRARKTAGDTKKKSVFQPGISKPCAGCMGAIVAFGIKRVVYSVSIEGDYKTNRWYEELNWDECRDIDHANCMCE